MKLPLGTAATALSIALSGAPGAAGTIVVDPGGAGDFSHIQPALDAAADGDTVLVKPGEYVIAEPLRFNRLHDAGNPASPPLRDIVLRAEGGPGVTVLRGVEGIDSVVLFYWETRRSVLDGFTVTGGGRGIRGAEYNVGGPGAAATIVRCVVRDNRSSGIDSHGGLVFASTITGNGDVGMHCSLGEPVLVGCTITGNARRGLEVGDSSGNPVVFHSSVSGNSGLGVFGGETGSFRLVGSRLEDNTGNGISCEPDSGGTLVNCVVASNGGDGVSTSADGGVSLSSCTVTGNAGEGVVCNHGSTGQLNSCIVWNDTILRGDIPEETTEAFNVTRSIVAGDVVFPGDGNSNADPLFAGAKDYHLQAGSPAIDAGTADGAPTSDIEGWKRPCGGGVDMGAYEYGDCNGEVIVDNRAPETVETGRWLSSGGSHPFGDGSVYAYETDSAFTFAPRVPRPGDYDVFLWWTEWPSRIRSVPVEILSAQGRTMVHVDQGVGGGRWNRIATLPFEEAGVIRVFATTGGSTCADAVRLAPVTAEPGTTSVGSWSSSGGTMPYGGSSLYSKQSGASYRYALNVPAPGSYRAWMWWSGFPSRPSSVRVDVEHAAGTSSVQVSQQVNAGQWNELGMWDFGATAVITIFAASAGSTCADAVRLTAGGAPPPYEKVIDNGEPGTKAVGYWPLSGGASPYGSSSLYSKDRGATYSYSFEVPAVDEYEVFLWWTAYPSRPSSVAVEVALGTGDVRTLSVTQTTNASRWNSLGRHVLSSRATVTVRSGGVGSTCADAARIVRRGGVEPPPLPAPLAYWSFDEGSGTTAHDGAGGRHASIVGATWTAGREGQGLRFDGEDDYVIVPGTFRFQALTFAAWVQAGDSYLNNRRIITLHDGVDPSYYHFDLEANTAGGLLVYAGGATVNNYEWTLSPGLWTHVAVTYNGVAGRIYWNGQLIEEGPLAVGPREGTIYIGGVEVPNGAALIWFGLIDEVVVFDHSLAAEQIWRLYVDGVR
jgi:hypothetical protein